MNSASQGVRQDNSKGWLYAVLSFFINASFGLVIVWIRLINDFFLGTGSKQIFNSGDLLLFSFTLYVSACFSYIISPNKKTYISIIAGVLAFVFFLGVVAFLFIFFKFDTTLSDNKLYLFNISQMVLVMGALIFNALIEKEKVN